MSESNGNGKLLSEENHRIVDNLTEDQAQRKRIKGLMEAAAMDFYGILGQGFDPYDMYQDMAGWGAYPYVPPPWYRQNQKRGEVVPVYLDENQLRFLRDRSRKLWQENCFVRCAIANLQNYSVGEDGLTIRAVSSDKTNPAPEQLLQRVQKVVDLWSEANERPEFEADIVERLVIDGDKAFRHFFQPKGIILLRDVESEHIKPPPGGNYPPHYSFGIQTDPDDIHTVEGYWVVENPIVNPLPVFVPADEVCYFKWNTPRSAKRGLPLFYETETMLRDAVDLLRGCVVTANIRARYAVVRKFASPVIKEAVNKFLDEVNTATVTDPTTGQFQNVERKPFGSIVNVGANTELDFPQANLESNQFYQALQMVLRAIAARICFPEFMLTADACLSENTYILTEHGWKSVHELGQYDKVGTIDKNGNLEYQVPTKHYKSHRKGDMVHLSGRSIDATVTPNHDLWIGQRLWQKIGWQKIQAGELKGRWSSFNVLNSFGWVGEHQEVFNVPGIGCVSMDHWLEFLGIFAGDGSTATDSNQITIGGVTKKRKIEYFGPVLEPLGFNVCNREDGTIWHMCNKELHDWLREHVGTECKDKRLPAFVQNLTPTLLKHLWKGLLASDGHKDKRKSRKHNSGRTYSTTSKQLADDVQLVLLKMGKCASISECPPGGYAGSILPVYKVHSCKGGPIVIRDQNVTTEKYDGIVWCVTVPNGLIVTRCNGKVIVSGNSNANYASTLVAEAPSTKMFATFQKRIKRKVAENRMRTNRSLAWTQVVYAVEVGILPPETLQLVKLQAEGATLVVRDQGGEAQTNGIYVQMGVKSKKTVSMEQGLDYEQEQANILEEAQQALLQQQRMVMAQQAGYVNPQAVQQGGGKGGERKPSAPGSGEAGQGQQPQESGGQYSRAELMHGRPVQEGRLMFYPETDETGANPKETNPKLKWNRKHRESNAYKNQESTGNFEIGTRSNWEPVGNYGKANHYYHQLVHVPTKEVLAEIPYGASTPNGTYHNEKGRSVSYAEHRSGVHKIHDQLEQLAQHLVNVTPFENEFQPHDVQNFFRPAHEREENFYSDEYLPEVKEGQIRYGNLSESLHTHLRELARQAREGGFTYSLLNDEQPSKGFAVSPYPARSMGVDRDQFGWRDLIHYVKLNKDLLTKAPHHFGAWFHEPSGKIILDVSKILGDPKQAEQQALYHDQQDYYDLAGGKSITVNPNATSGGIIDVAEPEPASTLPAPRSKKAKGGASDPAVHRVEGQAANSRGTERIGSRIGRVDEGDGAVNEGVAKNIKTSAADESAAIDKYHRFAKSARKAGDHEAADEWERIAKDEKEHLDSFEKQETKEGEVHKRLLEKEPSNLRTVAVKVPREPNNNWSAPGDHQISLHTNPSEAELHKFLLPSSGGKAILDKSGNLHVWPFQERGWTPNHEDVAQGLGYNHGEYSALTLRPSSDGAIRGMARIEQYADPSLHRTMLHHINKMPWIMRHDLGDSFEEGLEEARHYDEKEFLVESDDEGDEEAPPPRAIAKGKFIRAKRVEPRIVLAKTREEAPAHILPNMVSPGAKKVLVSTNPKSDIYAMGTHGPDHPKTPNQPFVIYSDNFKKQYPRPSAHHDEAIALDMQPAHREEAKIILSNGQEAPPHIKASMVRPGVRNFRVALDPSSEVWITPGEDRNTFAGKSKAVHNPSYTTRKEEARQSRVLQMLDDHDTIQDQIQADRKVPHKRDLAEIAWLLDKHGIRIGGDDTTRENQLRQQVDFDSPLTPDMIVVNQGKKFKRGEKKGQRAVNKVGILVDDDPVNPTIGRKRQALMKTYGRSIPKNKVVVPIDDRVKPGFTDYRDEGTAERLERFKKEGQPLGNVGDWLKAQGATTLQGKHVVLDDNGLLHLQFVGKGGVWHDHIVSDKELSTTLLQRARKAGPEGRLFNVPYAKALEYTKGMGSGNYTPHDFRRKRATLIAQRLIGKHWPKEGFKTDAEFDDALAKIAKVVAAKLGNHPNEARDTYIMPKVYEKYKPKDYKGVEEAAFGLGKAWGGWLGGDAPGAKEEEPYVASVVPDRPPTQKVPKTDPRLNDVPLPSGSSGHPPLPDLLKRHENYTPKEVMLTTTLDSTTPLVTKHHHVSQAHRIKLGNGEEAIFKPASGEDKDVRSGVAQGHGYKREAAVSSIADLLGMHDLVPATVEYNHPTMGIGSAQKWIPGMEEAYDVGKKYGTAEAFDGPEDHARAAALDYLVGNTDRHAGNWLLGPRDKEGNRKMWLIDHGYSLSNHPEEGNDTLLQGAYHRGLKIPSEVADWNWDDIEEILDHHKISPQAKELTRQRFNELQQLAGSEFDNLTDTKSFSAKRRHSTGVVPESPASSAIEYEE